MLQAKKKQAKVYINGNCFYLYHVWYNSLGIMIDTSMSSDVLKLKSKITILTTLILILIGVFLLFTEQVSETKDSDEFTYDNDLKKTFGFLASSRELYHLELSKMTDEGLDDPKCSDRDNCNTNYFNLKDIQLNELKRFPPLGYRIVMKQLFDNLEKFYVNCRDYPREENILKILNEESNCHSITSDEFIKEVIDYFFLKIAPGNMFYIYEKSTDKKSANILIYINYVSKRNSSLDPFDNDLILKPSFLNYISCREGQCLFIDFDLSFELSKQFDKKNVFCDGTEFCDITFIEQRDIISKFKLLIEKSKVNNLK